MSSGGEVLWRKSRLRRNLTALDFHVRDSRRIGVAERLADENGPAFFVEKFVVMPDGQAPAAKRVFRMRTGDADR
jgi:hypothetical protein